MLRKKAIAEFIIACQKENLPADIILDQLKAFITNIHDEFQITLIDILKEGEVVHPL